MKLERIFDGSNAITLKRSFSSLMNFSDAIINSVTPEGGHRFGNRISNDLYNDFVRRTQYLMARLLNIERKRSRKWKRSGSRL